MNEPDALQIEVQNIDHLGIVAGIVDEIGLVEKIDHLLGTHSQEHVSPGRAVKAMILNGLGFVSAPLYLFEEFFYGKATGHLIGAGINPEHLNDDRLGRVLDKLFEAAPSRVFVDVALRAARHFGVRTQSVHLDATSLPCMDSTLASPNEMSLPPCASPMATPATIGTILSSSWWI